MSPPGRLRIPWKSFRGVMAGTLILEAIVVLLALPVVSAVGEAGCPPVSTGYVIGVAVLLVLMAGIQGRSWAIWANLGVQLLLIAGWVDLSRPRFHRAAVHVVWLLHRVPAGRGAPPAEARPSARPAATAAD